MYSNMLIHMLSQFRDQKTMSNLEREIKILKKKKERRKDSLLYAYTPMSPSVPAMEGTIICHWSPDGGGYPFMAMCLS